MSIGLQQAGERHCRTQLNSKMILQPPTAPRAPFTPSNSKKDPQKGFSEAESTVRIQASRMLQGYPGQGGMLSPEVSKNSSVIAQSCAERQERDWLAQHFPNTQFLPCAPTWKPRRLLHPFSKLTALTATQGHWNQQFKKKGKSSQEFHAKKGQ